MKRRIGYLYSRFGWAGVISAVRLNLGGSDNLFKVEREDVAHPFYLRMQTSDIPTFDQVFVDQEYDFFTAREPEVIVDAGANIGLAAIFFASRYPSAKVIAIEPEESNFELLKRNVADYDNIVPVQAALWDSNEDIRVVDPGLGKWAFMTEKSEHGMSAEAGTACPLVSGKTVDRIMKEHNIQRIDILKVDIEGAEKEVFTDTSSWIDRVDSIIVELHERMKPGCNRSFYNGSNGFDREWRQGENVYLSRGDRLSKALG